MLKWLSSKLFLGRAMTSPLDDRIVESRCLLQNPYAYLDGDGGFSAVTSVTDDAIAKSRRLLQDPYAHLDGNGRYSAIEPVVDSHVFRLDVDDVRDPKVVGKRIPFEKIEQIARAMQTTMWVNRRKLGNGTITDDPFSVLNSGVAFEAIGYNFEVSDTLGQFMTNAGMVDCAGFIDKSKAYAGVASHFPLPVRNFTAAHELGHALLHGAVGMHRDRALDGSSASGKRDRVEIEADKFAGFFLMPEKLMRAEFQRRFGAEQFLISDDTSFALISGTQEALRRECKDLRGLARKLADAGHYAGRFFDSMTQRFGVSTEAMAIRLEELQLLQF
jgi:Zn-dependent peptidase ImmA (M78 family)